MLLNNDRTASTELEKLFFAPNDTGAQKITLIRRATCHDIISAAHAVKERSFIFLPSPISPVSVPLNLGWSILMCFLLKREDFLFFCYEWVEGRRGKVILCVSVGFIVVSCYFHVATAIIGRPASVHFHVDISDSMRP